MRYLGGLLAAGALLAATACSSGSSSPPAPSTIPPSPAAAAAAGSMAYLDNVRDEQSGAKGLDNAPDDQVLGLGTTACQDLAAAGGTSSSVQQTLTQSALHPSASDAAAVLQAAVANLCPDEAAKVPDPSASDAGH
jgi:hypothetical protein